MRRAGERRRDARHFAFTSLHLIVPPPRRTRGPASRSARDATDRVAILLKNTATPVPAGTDSCAPIHAAVEPPNENTVRGSDLRGSARGRANAAQLEIVVGPARYTVFDGRARRRTSPHSNGATGNHLQVLGSGAAGPVRPGVVKRSLAGAGLRGFAQRAGRRRTGPLRTALCATGDARFGTSEPLTGRFRLRSHHPTSSLSAL
ncbi:hypothetical protein GGQ64_002289 [Rhizobium azooxidifex]|uniref:Uncharacterized protein n=1 Tax=Mycoplana azooxidifex TaxID=1636188 RepID=A0A7W6GKN4_9HYPH|nr:hypothetical protein [Mycoplana azooxidifex]